MREIAAEWHAEKEVERQATENRRLLEDEMVEIMNVAPNLDGTITNDFDGYIIKITGRIDRKVDGDKVQELAAEFGLTEHLAKLFRWKPEINLAIWKAADESITKPLASAITAKPGRPSFTISHKE
jgi:predicted fused transcriptional regulator/phosphomethylpyrimidine kinase